MAKAKEPKIIQDLKECVRDLKQDYKDNQYPVTDDNTALHKFCAKLEYLLQVERKEKSSLLGGRKEHWNYFYECLYKVKGLNDGIRFVKSLNEVRLPLGKGRAFIRYSLVHQRLADTLQQCVMNQKVTSDWYKPKSVLLNSNYCMLIINDLYDLNDIQFDLSPTGYDLDNAWPTFARKSFGIPAYGLWQPPSRSSSVSSLTSLTSQPNDSFAPGSPRITTKLSVSEEKYTELQIEVDQQQITIEQLRQEIDQLQIDKDEMKKLALDTETRLSDVTNQLQRKIQDLEYKASIVTTELETKGKTWDEEEKKLISRLEDAEKTNNELYVRIDCLNKQHESREKVFSAGEHDLRQQLKSSEACSAELRIELKSLQQELLSKQTANMQKKEHIQDLEGKLQIMESKCVELIDKMEGYVDDKDSKASDHFDSSNKVHELLNKMTETETLNISLKGENDELHRKVQSLKLKLEENEKTYSNNCEHLQCELEELQKASSTTEEICKSKLAKFEKTKLALSQENELLKEQVEKQQSDLHMHSSEVDSLRVNVSKLNEELLSRQNDNQKKTMDAKKVQEDLNIRVSKLTNKLELIESERASEKDKLVVKIQELEERKCELINTCENLRDELRTLKIENSTLQTRFDETDSGIVLMKSVAEKTQVQLVKKNEKLEHVKTELSELRELVDCVDGTYEQMQNLTRNVSDNNKIFGEKILGFVEGRRKMEDRLKHLDNRSTEQETLVSELQQKTVKHEMEVRGLQLQLADLKTYISKLENEQVTLQSAFENKTQELEDAKVKFVKKDDDHQKLMIDVEELRKVMSQREIDFEKLLTEKEEVERHLSETREEVDHIQKENRQLQDMLREIEHDVAEKITVKDAETVELMLKEESLEKGMNDLRDNNIMMVNDNDDLKDKLKNMEIELENSKTEIERISRDKLCSDEKVREFESALERDRESLRQTQSTLDDLRKIHKDDSSQEQVFEERKQQMMKEHEDKEEFLKEQFKSIQDDLKNEVKIKSKELKDLKDQYDLLLKEKNEINDKNKHLNMEISRINEAYDLLVTEREEVQEKLEQSSVEAADKISSLTKEMDELICNVNAITLERDNVQITKNYLQKQLDERDEIMMVKEEKVVELQAEITNLKAMMESEVSALSFQLSTETMQYQQQLKTYADQAIEMMNLRDKNSENEQLTAQLERQLSQTIKESDQEIEKLRMELQEVSAAMAAKKEECQSLHLSVDKLSDVVQEEREGNKKAKCEISRLQNQLDNFEKNKETEMAQLDSDNAELKKRLIKLIRDKDNLWQKTDWLAHQQKLQAAERWLDDKEVSHCMLCNTEFSIITRRHHCRLCGRIFCHNCSNNWIMTKHSSKKARACQGCHAKLQHQQDGGLLDASLVEMSDDEIDPALLKSQISRLSMESGNDDMSSTTTTPDDDERSNSRSSFVTASSGVMSPSSEDGNEFPPRTNDSNVGTGNTNESVKPLSLLEEPKKVDPSASVVMTTGDVGAASETTMDDIDSSRDELFDLISDEEIAKTKEDEKSNTLGSSMEISDDSLTSSLTMSVEQLENPSNESKEIWIKPGKSYVVPVLVEKPGITLCWEFTTEPKNISFSVTYRETEETKLEDSQVLIPLCRCNSHRQAVQGELMARQCGLYTLLFDNSFSRFTSKKAKYKLQVKQPGAANLSN
ncbi:FYVE and coiled-coil domain-containing protein 1-like [Saccoglossus kowalevskii]|uniref:FYVE and coiled-coil domain-containing protein 1-like n=1 Tax=Saccoglossus kowalevskii TaxID=10224 RepID=A0ABM0H1B1_SACKO|nr:PREDICTED: FYVE and coiled-coil domain-containing protein 1-like [Saccoglossus kowalevskii]